MSWKQKIGYFLVGLAFLGLIALYALEFYYFKRTFGIRTMSLVAAGIGAVVGVILGAALSRKAEDAVDRIQVFLFCIVLCAGFSPLLASLSNRLLSPHPVKWEGVQFFEEKAYISERFGVMKGEKVKPRGYNLFFMREGKLVRIDNRLPLPGKPQRGDTLQIPVRKGLWGVEWVGAWP
ncbi:MAG: hypothetical protein IPH04_03580 [Saprospirales bacterium]|nr:hypothetical protein [Saprospirales bacterium]